MLINILKCSNNYMKFLISGIDTSFANALRRIIISGVSTWAIEHVSFINNTTVLHDEFIAHRLGLVPLSMPNGEDEPEQVTFTLNITATGTETWYTDKLISNDPNIVPIHNNIPIVKVVAGQELALEAIAVKGVGSDHSKWSPVCTCFFNMTDKGCLFIIETTGVMKPEHIVREAIKIMRQKLETTKLMVN